MIVARISEKVYYSKGGLAEHYQKKHNKKGGTAREDYLTGQIVINFKRLELVIRAAEKIQKQGYYSTNLKDDSFIVRFSCKYCPKLSELSSTLVRLGEFIINAKRRISLKMQFSIET